MSQAIPSTTPAGGGAPAGKKRPTAGLIDLATIMKIKNLELRARAIVEGLHNGLHRSPQHGFSAEFKEYRQYAVGDDPRYIDWRLYARSDRHYIKRFDDETNLRCYLVVDQSRSMGFSSLEYTKAEYAQTAAATLAYHLTEQRDAVGLLAFEQNVVEYLPPRYRPGHLHQLLMSLDRRPSGAGTDLSAPLEQLARIVAKRGLIVLLSDLLAPTDALERQLGYLRTHGHEIVIFRVLDPAEIDFNFSDSSLFQDLETGREFFIDPAAARENYLRNFQKHADAIELLCNRWGVDYFVCPTNQPLEWMLFDFLSARMRRGRQVLRKGGVRANVGGGGSA